MALSRPYPPYRGQVLAQRARSRDQHDWRLRILNCLKVITDYHLEEILVIIRNDVSNPGDYMYNPFLDSKKTLEMLVYLSKDTHDLFHLMKVMYYAEKLHFERYGVSIAGDYFCAMPDGPVPSGAYDMLKECRGDGKKFDERITCLEINQAISTIDNNTFEPMREPDLDLLSESNIEVLSEANRIYGKMLFDELWNLAHKEEAYIATKLNKRITDKNMVMQLADGKAIYEYLIN